MSSAQESVSSLKARIKTLEAETATKDERFERVMAWVSTLTSMIYRQPDAHQAFDERFERVMVWASTLYRNPDALGVFEGRPVNTKSKPAAKPPAKKKK